MTSAYPAPVDELVPRARRLAVELGEIPSRNKLMARLNIGAKKATQVRAALTEAGLTLATEPGTEHGEPPVTHPAASDPVVRVSAPPEPDTRSGVVDPPALGADLAGVDERPPSGPAASEQVNRVADPVDPAPSNARTGGERRVRRWRLPRWPLVLLALPAFVAIWSGWVGLGELTGFGVTHPLPGIWDGFTINTAITLPIGVETYAAYALRVWLAGSQTHQARRFAKYSALGSLALGMLGQVAYHLMSAAHVHAAPWQITTAVSCLPVVVLGFAAALDHLQRHPDREEAA